jgi:hypothetical protein
LIGGELVALDICRDSSRAIDDSGVKRVVHQAFIRKDIHSEHTSYVLNIACRSGEKMPCAGVGLPGGGVVGENVGLVPDWVECNRKQCQIGA